MNQILLSLKSFLIKLKSNDRNHQRIMIILLKKNY